MRVFGRGAPRRLLIRGTVALVTAAFLVPLSVGPGQAITGTVDANANALSGSVKLAGAAIPIPPTAPVSTSSGPVTGALPSLNILGAVSAGAITTAADADPLADTASANSSTAGVNIAGLLTVSAVTTSCSTASNGAAPTASAVATGVTSNLSSLGLTLAGSLPGGAAPANTDIPVKLVGATVGHLYMNTQTSSTSGSLRTAAVDGLRLSINAVGLAVVDVVVGHSDCTTTLPGTPTITSYTPTQGPQVGGTTLTVDGTNFLAVTSVTIDGVASAFTPVSQTRLTVTTPAHVPASVLLKVVNPTATATAATSYTYLPTPTVTAISPSTGPAAGGTTVTITGTGFTGATAVSFGGTAATSYTVVNATTITAVAPAGTGTKFVQVTAPGGTSATGAGGAWTYVLAPTLTSISPTSGPTTGGTTLTLTGTNFTPAATVQIDGVAASVTYVSPTSLQITTPAHAAGPVGVTVSTIGGTTGSATFTYLAVPTVSSFTPTYGTTLGGTSVTFTGTGLTSVTGVTFDGVAATLGAQSGTSLTVTAPVHALPGAVPVVLTGPGAITTSAGTYTYVLPGSPGPNDPTVTSLTPATGTVAGGTSVVIAGTNFTGATAVTFGGVAATSFTVDSATAITAVAPAGSSSGSVSVQVTTPVATSAVSVGGTYVYQPLSPVLTSLSPTHGPDLGGTTVTLTGSNFTVASTVLMDSVTTLPSSYVDPSHLSVTMPPHTAGTVGLQVQNLLLSSGSRTYTYDPTPTVSTMTPTSGTTAGGTTVTVTGTNLTAVTHVDVDGTDVTPSGTTATTLTFVTPAHAAGPAGVLLRDAATAGASSFNVSAGTYLYVTPAPTITGLSPTHGPLAGGTTVTITGTNLAGTSAVTIGANAATIVGTPTATSVTITTPASVAVGAMTLNVTTPGGTASTHYTYDALPEVSGLSPVSGPDTGGTTVTVTGTGLTGTTAVRFGATAGTGLTVLSDTQLTVVSPAHAAGQVDVTVTGPSGTSATTAADHFAFIDTTNVPTVTQISPDLGSTLGGTPVTITGTGFLGTTAVRFGGTAGTSLVVVDDTRITVTSPAHAAGAVHVTVTDPNGTSPTGAADVFTYVSPAAPPAVGSISPTSGPVAGGTAVTVTGVGFTGATAVVFGALPGTGLVVVNDTTLTVTSPPGALGTVHVRVTGPTGTSAVTSPDDEFTYVAVPVVTGLSPASGPEAGGTTVTVTGTGFTGATSVLFGAAAGTTVSVSSDTSLTVSSPPGSGLVAVKVVSPGGTTAVGSPFTYLPPPAVTSLTPSTGTTVGGTTVVIGGTAFTGASAVSFGGTPAAITLVTPTAITVTTPAHAAGTVDVVVTGPNGSSSVVAADRYTYVEPPPTLTGLSPTSGPVAGGTTVTLTGTGFTGATAVRFDGAAGSNLSISSDTSATVTTPAHAAGVSTVTVLGPGGTSNGVTYTYNPLPTVVGLTPSTGPASGGTAVTIVGTGFTATTAVQFGSVSAPFTVVNAFTITATSPVHTPGTVDVVVLGPNGASAAVAGDRFTFTPPITTSLAPASGPAAGGTTVTVTGSDFTGATAVTFDGVPGTSLAISSDTRLTVTSPPHAPGPVPLVVTGPDGSSSGITYTYNPLPSVTSLTPTSGTTLGGSTVVIAGADLAGATSVTFGGVPATVTLNTPLALTVTTPAHAAGLVDVAVTTADGTGTSVGAFTYVEPPPTLTSLSPANGPQAGGTSVTLTGTGFTGVTAVHFGAALGTGVTVSSDTSLTVTAPPGSGTVQVTVTRPSGTSNGLAYTYNPLPAILSVLPNSGTTLGGTTVVIAGTALGSATSVTFDGVPASVTLNTPLALTVTTPAHAAGLVDVAVTTADGTGTSVGAFTYIEPLPTLTSLSPANGPQAGGTSVTLTGTGFTDVTAVHFGAASGTAVTVSSDTSLTVTAPPGTGTVQVTVTRPSGTSNGLAYTYNPLPAIVSVLPSSGTTLGGTTVAIAGTDLASATSVTFGGVPATITLNTPIALTVTTPPHAAGPVDVAVTTPDGTTTSVGAFTYIEPPPTLTSLSPANGPQAGGTSVTLTGTGFTGVTAVHFGAASGTAVTVFSDTSLTVTAPPGSGTVQVTVTRPSGTSNGLVYTYNPLPAILSVLPNSGTTLGGDTVVIAGTDLTSATSVTFGGVPATVTLNTPIALTVTTPPHAAGPVDVAVTTPDGTATSVGAFTYVEPSPTLVGITPVNGPQAGGTSVTLTGTGFTGVTAVHFGAASGTAVTVSSDTSLTVTAPPGTGTVQVTVTRPSGTSNGLVYTYNPLPAILSVLPNSGTTLGGNTVVIAGTDLASATSVTFDGVPATITLNTPLALTVTTPPHAAGPVDVAVTTPDGTATSVGAFTYVEPPPTLVGITPANGPQAGGTSITLTGTGFTGVTAVHFGAASGTAVTVSSDTSLTVTAPPGSGTVQVTVTRPSGTSNSLTYTYNPLPAIISVLPSSGTTLGGTTVVIAGTDLTSATLVTFDGVPATITLNTPISLTVTTPAHAAGLVDVAVTTADGSGTAVGAFTYVEPPPTLVGISPANGPQAGGTSVTLTGTGFTGVTSVDFGGTPATNVTVSSDTSLTVTAPPGSGTVQVTVTRPSGTSNGLTYTYNPLPAIVSVLPSSGTTLGGTTVVIAGTDLTSATSVTFDGVPATITLNTPISLTVTTPAHAAGLVDVAVTTADGTGTAVGAFTYVEPPPTLTSLSPANGPQAGGTSVTLTGTGFTGVTAVHFGAALGTGVTVSSDTSLTVTAPPGSGTVQVTVTRPSGTSNGLTYNYNPLPAIVSVSPNSGTTLGGTTVVIAGTDLASATSVTFDGVPASITLNTPIALTVTTPAHAPGPVDITVTTPDGTTTSVGAFTYVEPAPTLAGITPANGPEAGGTSVTLTGTGFTGVTAVHFGAALGTAVTVSSDTSLTVTAPPGSGTVQVNVTRPSGTSNSLTYTYNPLPAILSVLPNSGTTLGGDTVVIAGTDLASATSVTFDGVPASIALNTPLALTVTTPAHAAGPVDVTVTTADGTATSVGAFTYVEPAPTLTNLNPATGPQAGGTQVTLTGTGFTGVTAVHFGAALGTAVTVSSDTSLTVTAPPGSGTVQVTATRPSGTSNSLAYSYNPLPAVVSVFPNSGTTLGGDVVVIAGTDLASATSVTFDGVPASITLNTPIALTVITPPHAAGPADVTVTTADGTTTAVGAFTYIEPPPTLTGLSPANGPQAGGTSVTLTGTGFTGVTAVHFGVTPGTNVTVSSDTSLTVTAPPGSGTVQVTVTRPSGTSNGLTYTYNPLPAITSLTPTSGTTLGGDAVVITGTDLTSATSVTFDGAPATITLATPTTITITTPAHPAGPVDVIVTTPDGTTTAVAAFTYVDPPPTLANLSPANGPQAGGTQVTLSGTGFTGVTAVHFGVIPGIAVTVSSDTSLTVTAPPGTGTVQVTVTRPSGTSIGLAYTYNPLPAIVSVLPSSGTTLGGDTVVIAGTALASATSVTFDGVPAIITLNTAIAITVTTPAHAAGPVDVSITSPDGTTTAVAAFTYVDPPPTLTNLSPANGPQAGGTSITLTGTGFTGITHVDFGGTPATNVTVSSDTSLTVTAPPGTGTVQVTVTRPSGTSNGLAYTYNPLPAIVSVLPSSGTTLGGDTVVITGTALASATSVTFDGVPAAITLNTPTAITVTTPAHAAAAVDVTVTTPDGSQIAVEAFTYFQPVPTLANLSPAGGPQAGGTQVTLTGTGFTGVTAVHFGAALGTAVTVSSDTSLTVTAPPGTGSVQVTVTRPSGTSNGLAYAYNSLPAIASILPSSGTTLGGDTVVITGTALASATSVTFDGVPAAITLNTPTAITVTTPAHTAGSVDVTVTTTDGSRTSAGAFTYLEPLPTIAGLNPATGPQTGGTLITVVGTGFAGATAVTFDGVAGTDLVVAGSTSLTVTSPAHSPGPVDVRVVTPQGDSPVVPAGTFTFVPSPPTVSGISPASGPVAGGTLLTITGSGFTTAGTVSIGGITVSTFTVVDDTRITLVTPAHIEGDAAVTVTNPGGTSPAGPVFTYLTPGSTTVVNGLSPARGPAAGGTRVTITGTGFTGAFRVLFGDLEATDVVVLDDSTVTAVSPEYDAAGGNVHVQVVGPAGASAIGPDSEYGYLPLTDLPALASFSPQVGPTTGGTRITVRGMRFDEYTTVTFGGVPGTDLVLGPDVGDAALRSSGHGGFRAAWSNTLEVDTPAHVSGTVPVTVTNAAGAITFGTSFTFVPVLRPTTLSIEVVTGTTRKVTADGPDGARLHVKTCSTPTGQGSVKLADDGGSCLYTAPARIGSDAFTMTVTDVLGDVSTQRVSVTVVADPNGGGDTGGTGGNETGGEDGGGTGGTGGNETGGDGGNGTSHEGGNGHGSSGLAFTGLPLAVISALGGGITLLLAGFTLLTAGRRRHGTVRGRRCGVVATPGTDGDS
jgi:IPT/TIG domain